MSKSQPATFIATIAYVRSLGIAHLDVWCEGKRKDGYPCGRFKRLSIEGFAPEAVLDDIGKRMRCDACGTLGKVDIRPTWSDAPSQQTKGPGSTGWMLPPEAGKRRED